MKSCFIPIYILLLLTIFSACKKEDNAAATPQQLTIAPGEALPGAFIAITGSNLENLVSIKFGEVSAAFSPVYNTSTAVLTSVPTTAKYGAQKVTVINKAGLTAQVDFIVKQPFPVVSAFSPASGPIGDTITITGTYLEKIQEVRIGNVAAMVVDSSVSTRIKIKIPQGASSGLITVVTGGGSSVSTTPLIVGERAVLIADFDGAGLIPNGGSWYTGGDILSRTVESSVPSPFSGNYLKVIPKSTSSSNYAGFETYDGSVTTFGLTSPASSTYLKFEVNNNGKTATVLQAVINDGSENYASSITVNGTGWQTISIKLADMKSGYGGGSLTPNPSTLKKIKFFFQGYANASMEANIDNVRFAY